jgi:hypothetical protein
LISYDEQSDTWVSIKGMAFCVLSQYVDVEPGTTLGRVFDMVDSDPDLKRFLGEYCGCDVDAIHKRPRDGGEPIQVITALENEGGEGFRAMGTVEADAVEITPYFYVYTDATGERRLDGTHMLLAKSKKWETGTTIHSQRDASFGFLCGLELRLDRVLTVWECDEDKQVEGDEDTIAFEASIQYTLLEVLLAIYGFFGEPPFDQRYQRQVDEDEAFFERLRDYDATDGENKPEDDDASPKDHDDDPEEPGG